MPIVRPGAASRPALALALLASLTLVPAPARGQGADPELARPLRLPEVGERGVRLISPRLLEVRAVTAGPGATADPWGLADPGVRGALLAGGDVRVRVAGAPARVIAHGFRRRVLYAPLSRTDLRVGHWLYLELDAPVPDGAAVEVANPSGRLWSAGAPLAVAADPLRYSPAIHVNQVGYGPDLPKVARVGLYLGDLGELVPPATSFELIEAGSGRVVFRGSLERTPDAGSPDRPGSYQQVHAADFSAWTTPGSYRLAVPGLGASLPFAIDPGVPAAFARSYALGLYHQRCGSDNAPPFSRFDHGPCHTAPAEVPGPGHAATQRVLAEVSADALADPRHTAPRLDRVEASLYPFVTTGPRDVSGGHHDAGDYSKYTTNSAGLLHALLFAVDAFAGVAALDGLGLPESGDGVPDVLQEARQEAQFLARLQDGDGGFHFLVYPRDRRYEQDVLPDRGDPQVVWPKNTAATAAATAALAEAGSSPAMRRHHPADAARYLDAARRGWAFLEAALARFGHDGAYQKLTHYGATFRHDDELAWAAAALFAATGEARYHDRLRAWFRPGDRDTWRWGWWRLFEGYGCAARAYAFASRSGRLPASALDPTYLAACQAELLAAGEDGLRFAREHAYGTSFPGPSKAVRAAGWYFPLERAFDLAVAHELDPRPELLRAIVTNLDFEAGCNPLSVSFLTGVGQRRQREVVHQYAQNDARALPPSGIPLGSLQSGFGWVARYGRTLADLSYPPDGGVAAPYPLYDRWADTFNTTTEFVVVDQGRGLATVARLMAASPLANQPWRPAAGRILGLPAQPHAGQDMTLRLEAPPGLDPARAHVVWEAPGQEPHLGPSFTFAPAGAGEQWVEAEACWPDGRRVVARARFTAFASLTEPPNAHRSAPRQVGPDTVALFHLDRDLADAVRPGRALASSGAAALDPSNVSWMAARAGAALRVHDLGDAATAQLAPGELAAGGSVPGVTLSAMIHVRGYRAANRRSARLLSLVQGWNAALELIEDPYAGLRVRGGAAWEVSGPALHAALTPDRWHHLALELDATGYRLRVDGQVVASSASDELRNWSPTAPATLALGELDGWLDEVEVLRGAGPAQPPTTPSTPTTPTTPTTPPTTPGASATWVGRDDATGGSWRGRYGREGWWIAGDGARLPDAALTVQGADYGWSDATSDRRALQRAAGPGRLAACRYGPEVTLELGFPDGRPRVVSVYLLDWDRLGREQRVERLDAAGQVLETRAVSGFQEGAYLRWEVRGALRLRLSRLQGPNAVVMGVFVDPPPGRLADGTVTVEPLAGGGIRLRVHGAPGQRYRVEGSTDLRTWSPVADVILAGATAAHDLPGAAGPPRFFRAVRQP